MIGIGIWRVFVGDIKAVAIAVVVFALVGNALAYVIGIPTGSGLKFGALLGFALALTFRSLWTTTISACDRQIVTKSPNFEGMTADH